MQQGKTGARTGDAGTDGVAAADVALTSIEAHVLVQIVLNQPITAFEIVKTYGRSPVAGLSGSPGAIYPVVKRLRSRGFITADQDSAAKRKVELLSSTEAGNQAARVWLSAVDDGDLLPHDPLRSKISFLSLLSKMEQMRFLLQARKGVELKLKEVSDYASARSAPYADLAFDMAKANLEARAAWIDDILMKISES